MRTKASHSGQIGGSIHDTSSGSGSGLGAAVAPSASAISLAKTFQHVSHSRFMRSIRPRSRTVGLISPHRWHKYRLRSLIAPMRSSVSESDSIPVGRDLASFADHLPVRSVESPRPSEGAPPTCPSMRTMGTVVAEVCWARRTAAWGCQWSGVVAVVAVLPCCTGLALTAAFRRSFIAAGALPRCYDRSPKRALGNRQGLRVFGSVASQAPCHRSPSSRSARQRH
jgi:hypothetical protein